MDRTGWRHLVKQQLYRPRIDGGPAVIENMLLERCELSGAFVRARSAGDVLIRNVEVLRCGVRRSWVHAAEISDCVLRGLKVTQLHLRGCTFQRVVLEDIRGASLFVSDLTNTALDRASPRLDYAGKDDWALDVRRARSWVVLSGVPPHRVIVDDDTQGFIDCAGARAVLARREAELDDNPMWSFTDGPSFADERWVFITAAGKNEETYARGLAAFRAMGLLLPTWRKVASPPNSSP